MEDDGRAPPATEPDGTMQGETAEAGAPLLAGTGAAGGVGAPTPVADAGAVGAADAAGPPASSSDELHSPSGVLKDRIRGSLTGEVLKQTMQGSYAVAIFAEREGGDVTPAMVEDVVRRLLPNSKPQAGFVHDPDALGHNPNEVHAGSVTVTFFARLGLRDKKRLLELVGVDDPLDDKYGDRKPCEEGGPDRVEPIDRTSRSEVDKRLNTLWTRLVVKDRRQTAEALAKWKEEDQMKWKLNGGNDDDAAEIKEEMLVDFRTEQASAVRFGKRPIFVKFTSGDSSEDMTNARRLIQALNGKKLFGRRVQVDLAFRFRDLLKVAGRRAYNPADLLDVHALSKVLMWVWGARDELVPDTIQQEFKKDHWDRAWRNVLATNLRAGQDSKWIQSFQFAFPDIRENPPGNLVKLIGPPSRVEQGYWLGEQEFIRRPIPQSVPRDALPSELGLAHAYGLHDGGSLQQYEQEFAAESFKILSEVFTSLDADGGGKIDRGELNDFFSNERDEKGLVKPTWRNNRDWEDFADTQLKSSSAYDHARARQGKGSAQKQKMDADRYREQDELRARTDRMKEKLFEDQKRACCLNMTDKQFKALVRALMEPSEPSKTEPASEPADFDAPNIWLANERFPQALLDKLRRGEGEQFTTSAVCVPAVQSGKDLIDRLGVTFGEGSHAITYAPEGGIDLDTNNCVTTGWVLAEVNGVTIPARLKTGDMATELDDALKQDGDGCGDVECIFRQHVAYPTSHGVPPEEVRGRIRRSKSIFQAFDPLTQLRTQSLREMPASEKRSLIEKYMMRGEFDKVSFGLPQGILDQLNIPDPELVHAPRYIVSEDDRDRLRLKAKEFNIEKGTAAYELIFGTMIEEDEFRKAYIKATGVDVAGAQFRHVWEHISQKFGGMIDKEIFFKFCRTEAAEPVNQGVGGSYYVAYCQEQRRRIGLEQNLFIFILFLLCFSYTIVLERGLGEGYYQTSAIENTIVQEIGGGSEHSAGGTWYAWYFYDIAQLEEWWAWMDMVLELEYPGGGTSGIGRLFEHANMIHGAVKLQQWRTKPTKCGGLADVIKSNNDTACYGAADASEKVDSVIEAHNRKPSNFAIEQRSSHSYMVTPNDFTRSNPVCFLETTPTSFPDSVTIGVFPWNSNRLEVEVLKWLIEEKLNVGVSITVLSGAEEGITKLLNGQVDVLTEVWELYRLEMGTQAADLKSAIAQGTIINGGSIGIKGESALMINSAGVTACPGCTSYRVLKQEAETFANGCDNFCRHNCSRCGLSVSSTNTARAQCTTCPASLLAVSNTDTNATYTKNCNAAAVGCGFQKGALWDLHPGLGTATFGPELYRSTTLALGDKFDMVYATSTDELEGLIRSSSDPMAFFFYKPSAAPTEAGAQRVVLPTYSAANCPLFSPSANDPAMETKFDCDVPKSNLLTLYRKRVHDDLPQVATLLNRFVLSDAGINSMLNDAVVKKKAYDVSACDWLQANKETWNGWIRNTRSADAAERGSHMWHQCFDVWDGANDKESFTQNARYLSQIAPTAEMVGLTGDCRTDCGGGTCPACQKVLQASDAADNLVVPSTAEWKAYGVDANQNRNITAEALFKRLEPWMCQDCPTGLLSLKVGGRMYSAGMQSAPRHFYPCDGYKVYFPVSWTMAQGKAQMTELMNNNWIDDATRAVMIEFFTYNQNSGLYVRSRYLGEIGNTGGWEMSQEKVVFRLHQFSHRSEMEKAAQIVLIVFTLFFTVYFTTVTVRTLVDHWKIHVKDRRSVDASAGHNAWCPFWRYGVPKLFAVAQFILGTYGDIVDISNYILMYVAWMLRFAVMFNGLTEDNLLCTDVYPEDLNNIADMKLIISILDGVNAILVVLRLLFFLSIFPDVQQILGTIFRAGGSIAWLLVSFMLIVSGFALCGWVVYGNVLKEYNGLWDAFVTLIFFTNGEFNYPGLDSQRPGFAFFFFFTFFVLVVCILFNLIIAVIGNAYDAEKATYFNIADFIERVRHDPDTAAWGPDEAMGAGAWMQFGPVTREIRYQVYRFLHLFHKCTGGRFMSSKGCCSMQRVQKAFQANPRTFWANYEKLMLDLSSDNICTFLSANAKIRMLIANSKVQQEMPTTAYQTGDSVYVRDNDDNEWLQGTVVQIEGSKPLVLPNGWERDRLFREDDDNVGRRKGYEWRYVVVDDHDYKDNEYVTLSQDVTWAYEMEVDRERDRVRAKLLKGTVCTIEHIYDPPIAGTPPFRKGGWRALVRVNAKATRKWHEDRGTNWEMDDRDRAPDEGILRAEKNDNACFIVNRADIEPLAVRLDRHDDELKEAADVQLLKVAALLETELHEQKEEIGFFLVGIPQKVLGGNMTRSWVDLLQHFHFWKNKVKSYTKLDKESEDLVEETHGWCKAGFKELGEDINHIRHGGLQTGDDSQNLSRGGSLPGIVQAIQRLREDVLGEDQKRRREGKLTGLQLLREQIVGDLREGGSAPFGGAAVQERPDASAPALRDKLQQLRRAVEAVESCMHPAAEAS
eukprot:TRINITY_DN1003_c5_g1_i1.p1 TRINITY_DN1003_c5_g1~~TRINITY_DN1003_c5_g1_i1.p1  ORF type:complete len:2485 (+),score=874.39 TRINITY_DN1003_c5_g1_i1:169-7623(+)